MKGSRPRTELKSVETAVQSVALSRMAKADVAREFDRLYRVWAQQVAAWARRLGGPALDVEDVVQEVFVVLHRRLPDLTDPDRLTSWMFQLTENMVRHQRRAQRWGALFGRASARAEAHGMDPTAPEQIEQRQAADRLYACLDKLSDRYRVPLILFEIDGLPCDRIAALLDLTVPAVWTRIHRGREQLLARLQKLEALEARRAAKLRGAP